MRRKYIYILCVVGVSVFLSGAEVVVRWSGASDFPVYDNSVELGYVPSPSQKGALMGRKWAFNSLSMGVEREFVADGEHGVLLLGDSIVLGGNAYDQRDKLGPTLGERSGLTVWPASAGSWSLLNELAYVQKYGPVVLPGVDAVVFVLNNGDFEPKSVWRSEFTHPTQRWMCSACYVFARILYSQFQHDAVFSDAELRGAFEDGLAQWSAFVKRYERPIYVILYPNKKVFLDKAKLAEFTEKARALSMPNVAIFGISDIWKLEYYRDDIHPTKAGIDVLASRISEILGTCGAEPSVCFPSKGAERRGD